jgi:plastocyanin
MDEHYSRRRFVASASVVSVAALAGCGGSNTGGDGTTTTESGGGAGGQNVVAAGPNQELVFEPEEITVSTGDTVTWEFESTGHNVSAYPEMHERVSIPEGADGFGTMEAGGDPYATVPEGETFQHTFETAGEFTYVCVPHAASGMVGTVVVE